MSKINKQEIEKKEVNNIVETVKVGDVKENVEAKEFKRKWKTIKNFKNIVADSPPMVKFDVQILRRNL